MKIRLLLLFYEEKVELLTIKYIDFRFSETKYASIVNPFYRSIAEIYYKFSYEL